MAEPRSNFLTDIIDADLAAGRAVKIVTRFPPEPNGFLHLGHSKSIILNFGLGVQYQGRTHLRFDDTNPITEETLYVDNIQNDVKWLGYDWGTHLYYASDFFPQMYECALWLIDQGLAYVDTQSVDAIREQRGDFGTPGKNSPFRDRSPKENRELFEQMKAGKLKDGEAVLRGKIDMAHPNVLMRDPLLYRIRHAHHHRTGDTWCIYPMYDYAHPLEDAFEGVTHSICTLEFESNRPLYDWVLDKLDAFKKWSPRPHQYEFARLALGYTVMSKRKLLQLVQEKRVSGWDDPRMPTIAGMRRRGVSAEALKTFAELVGVAKNNSLVDIGKFEFAIRGDLEARSPRAFGVIDPLKVTITNWSGKTEELDVPWWPGEPAKGSRKVPFTGELFIDREDFALTPPKDWKRLAVGAEVRLLHAYAIVCDEAVKDASGKVIELKCRTTATPGDGKKTAGNIHWVSASAPKAEVRLYDRLFKVELPDAEKNFLNALNPDSLAVTREARVEPALLNAKPGERFQFMRMGYFIADPIDSKPGAPIFNRTITLKDTWAKPVEKAERKKDAPTGGPKKSRAEVRAELHASNPAIAAEFARLQKLGLGDDEADTLATEPAFAKLFDAARAGASPKSVAKWVVNDLLGAGKPADALPFDGATFGRFVALVDGGKLTPAAGKTLLGKLVESGGDPEALMNQLGLEKVQDAGALDAAVQKVLTAQAAEVARYRAGEKKLIGVFIGAVMKETGGAADAAAVRKALTEKLG